MSQKKKDDKNRWRNITVAFRVSPEENEELNMRVKLSGAETKREYIIQSVLRQQVVAKGNPLMLVTFRRELQHIEKELERLTSIDEMDSELLTPIRSMLEILEGFRKNSKGKRTMSVKKALASVNARALEMHNASLDKSIVARRKGRYN